MKPQDCVSEKMRNSLTAVKKKLRTAAQDKQIATSSQIMAADERSTIHQGLS